MNPHLSFKKIESLISIQEHFKLHCNWYGSSLLVYLGVCSLFFSFAIMPFDLSEKELYNAMYVCELVKENKNTTIPTVP